MIPVQTHFSRPHTANDTSDLEVVVLFTTGSATLQALKTAGQLVKGLSARIRLLVPQVVPFPLALDEPPVPVGHTARRVRTVIDGCRIPTFVDIRFCRDRRQMLEAALRPASLVVLGGRRRWWPTAEDRLARQLRASGHHVLLSICQ